MLKDLVNTEDQRSEYEVDIILHENPNVSPEALAPYVAEKTGVSVEDMEICANKIRLVVQQDSLNDVATLDSVNRIEEVRPKEVYSNYARQVLHADTLSQSTSYRGDGQVICVADTGFDQGKMDNSMHPAFTGRIKSLQSFWEDDARDPVGHGTHVCGCVCGDGTFTGFPDEPVAVQGTAPAAKLMVQAMSKEDKKRNWWGFNAPANLDRLFREPYEMGGRIHNNSWGDTWDNKVGQLDYNDDATTIDRFIHEHQDFVVLLAAGNDAQEINAGSSQIGDNSAAKNAITVGATGTTRPNMFSLESDADAEITGKAASIATADFSSRGPTKSTKNTNGEEVLGRIKPDVVAPGVSIMSAASRATTSAHRAKINRRNGATDDDDWFFMSGTSMATPLVAGCAALIREAMGDIGKSHPSAALVKALLVNGAVNYSSPKGPGFDYEQGFGRVDINQSVSMVTNRTFVEGGGQLEATKWDVAPLRQAAGEDRWKSADIALPSGKSRLVATLAYSDPPGGLLQNNINLIVRVGGEERHGNMGIDSGFDNTSKSTIIN